MTGRDRHYIADKVRGFKLREGQDVRQALVEAIPSNWRFMNGSVWAPDSMCGPESGIAAHSGYRINRSPSAPMLHAFAAPGQTKLNSDEALKQAFEDLVLKQKKPAFIHFNEAGWYKEPFSLSFCKEVMQAYVARGYHTSFAVTSSHKDDDYGSWREEYHLCPKPWEVHEVCREGKPYPPAILLEWQEKEGGTWEKLEPIAAACRSIGLEELTIER